MKKTNRLIPYILAATFTLSACSKDDDLTEQPYEEPVESAFVLTAASNPAVPVDYLYTSSTLEPGVLTTEGKGVEQDGTYHNYIVNNGLFFSLLFGQTNPGAVSVYKMNGQKQLEKVSSFQTESMTAFTNVGTDILLIKNAWQPAEQYTKWYRLDTKSLQIVDQGEIDAVALTEGKGEKAFFTDIKKVGDKVFAPFWPIQSGKNFATEYSQDSTFVAVYSYPSMTLEKIIKDSRTGGIGAYYTSGIEVDEKGDVYTLGTKLNVNLSNPFSESSYSTATPVAFTKIKNGTTEHDLSYFFDITSASGGEYVYKKLYMGKGNFLLTMVPKPYVYATVFYAPIMFGGIKFAIANVYDKTFKWVTGAPGPSNITSTSEYSASYSPLDGTGYVPIYYKEGGVSKSSVFKFDAATATATPTLTTDGKAAFTSIHWMPVTK